MATHRVIQDIDEIDPQNGGADTEHHTKCARARYHTATLLHARNRYLPYWIFTPICKLICSQTISVKRSINYYHHQIHYLATLRPLRQKE